MTDTTGWTTINIETPLPMGVAGALMQLIGTAYPESVLKSDTGRANKMVIEVDARKPAIKISKKEAARIRQEAETGPEELQMEFLGFDQGWIRTAPSEELCHFVGAVAHRIITGTEGAINYLEWEVVSPATEDSPYTRYVLSAARSKGQTPHAMRMKAEAENEKLKALLAEHGIEIPKD